MYVITTARLRLRPLSTADTDWWVDLHADPEVSRFVGTYSRERAAARLRAIEDQWEQRGHGLCAVELAATGETIGRSGLFWWEQFDETEAGWTLARPYWGHGYATEAARAVLDRGFDRLSLPRITAMIHHGNDDSTAVARRLGFAPLREDELFGQPLTVHVLDRTDRTDHPV
ncbi:GNAT family N-acetyltransferase [Saccharothrix sp. ST-888]|uniref:GNAT family N-acetyltransferase n=1 Tax=Saccharothrix sp. ST-888 TaxID=1427391 RepID=UPI0005EC9299|nr:GNAT family N-acetyltransferase [Saccharothrix sp. ST-888]KJK55444.1 GCN5 family acetyltransferase [Saccharothrix sp. ST-888]